MAPTFVGATDLKSGRLTEGEVDPLTLAFACLVDPVQPVFLGVAGHHEERTVFELHVDAASGAILALQREGAAGAQADRSDRGLRTQLRLVVGVESDRIPAVAVEVEEVSNTEASATKSGTS